MEYPNRRARNPDTRGVYPSCGKVLSVVSESPETRETAAKGLTPDSKKPSDVPQRSMMLCQEDSGTLKLDKLDIEILRSLNENARKSFRDIMKELHVSLRTVSKKVKAMERAGLIQGYIPIIDATKVGFDIMVVIGILTHVPERVSVGTEKELAKNPAVFAAFNSTGQWDAVMMARFRNISELNAFVKNIQAHENVDRIYTQVVLNVTKDEKRVLV